MTIPKGFHYPIAARIPGGYPVSDTAADKAYCRLHGLVYAPRVVPEIPTTNRPHPRSACWDTPSKPLPTRPLTGQLGLPGVRGDVEIDAYGYRK